MAFFKLTLKENALRQVPHRYSEEERSSGPHRLRLEPRDGYRGLIENLTQVTACVAAAFGMPREIVVAQARIGVVREGL